MMHVIDLVELVELVLAEVEVDSRTNEMKIKRTLCNASPRGPRLRGSKQLTFFFNILFNAGSFRKK